MIIDAHTHGIYGDTLEDLAEAGGAWARNTLTSYLNRSTLHNLVELPAGYNAAKRVELLDTYGIDVQVVTPFNWLSPNHLPYEMATRVAYARVMNDGMARFMDEGKGRLICAAAVPLEDFEDGGRQEMERAIKTLGLKAVTIPTNIQGKPIDTPEFEPFWALAAALDVPVYIHPWHAIDVRGRPYEAEWDLSHVLGWPFETELALSRLVFSGIVERYPTLKIVNHHLGGGLPFLWGRMEESYADDFQEKALGRVLPAPLFESFHRCFYYDTAVGGSAAAIRCAYEVMGPDRLVFATDYPWGPGGGAARLATYSGILKSVGLPEADLQKIFADNMRRIFKI